MTVSTCKTYRIFLFLRQTAESMRIWKPEFMRSTIEKYRDHLESLIGNRAEVFRYASIDKGYPPVFTLTFDDTAQKYGKIIFTYGLSYRAIPEWKEQRIELCLRTGSQDATWGHALGFLANNLRTKCPFTLGQIIQFGQQISKESTATQFLITPFQEHCNLPSDVIDINKKSSIKLLEIFPVTDIEANAIQRQGWRHFLSQKP